MNSIEASKFFRTPFERLSLRSTMYPWLWMLIITFLIRVSWNSSLDDNSIKYHQLINWFPLHLKRDEPFSSPRGPLCSTYSYSDIYVGCKEAIATISRLRFWNYCHHLEGTIGSSTKQCKRERLYQHSHSFVATNVEVVNYIGTGYRAHMDILLIRSCNAAHWGDNNDILFSTETKRMYVVNLAINITLSSWAKVHNDSNFVVTLGVVVISFWISTP